jgi:hypothetical protein
MPNLFGKKFYVIIKCDVQEILGTDIHDLNEDDEFFYYPDDLNEVRFFKTAQEARTFMDTFPSLF